MVLHFWGFEKISFSVKQNDLYDMYEFLLRNLKFMQNSKISRDSETFIVKKIRC